MNSPPVLYEDNHLLVIDKPCGLPTMGMQKGVDSVAKWAATYIKLKYRKPGNVYVGIVSRLDAAASGLLVLAKTSKAASRLSDQIRQRSTQKRYLAVVEGRLNGNFSQASDSYLELVHHLRKNDSEHKIEAVSKSMEGAQRAESRLRVIQKLEKCAVVEVDLVTGRKHQIRVQLSTIGNPVLCDRKYGGTCVSYSSLLGHRIAIALHCYRLTIEHPTRRERLTFHSFPRHWTEALNKLNVDQQLLKKMCNPIDGEPQKH